MVLVVELAVVPELGRIADRRDPDIGMREQGLDVRDPLPARADHGHVQLLARRGLVPGPPRTWDGTILAAVNPAVPARNRRRLRLGPPARRVASGVPI